MARAELETLADALEKAEGPSLDLDRMMMRALFPNATNQLRGRERDYWVQRKPTAFIDGAVALIERFPRFDSAVLLAESFDLIWQDGWPKAPPLGPILARAACLRLIRSLIAQEGA